MNDAERPVLRVLVLGATGFIGRAVSARLAERGDTVVALARSDASAGALTAAGHEVVRGDLHDAAALRRAVDGVDAVVNVAADQTDLPISEPQLAADLVDALAGSGRRLVWTSGVLVTGPTGAHAVDESAPLVLEGPLGWRARTEAFVLDAGAGRGLTTACIRPPFVHSEEGAAVVGTLLAAAQGREAVVFPGDGTARWSTVHVDDLADLYVLALDAAESGVAYIAASDEVIEVQELAELVSRRHGYDGRVEALAVEELRPLMGPFADMLGLHAVFSGRRARDELGWSPDRATMRESLR